MSFALTKEELRSSLSHSNQTQLIVEGRDDFRLLRLIENFIPNLVVQPANGRDDVIYVAQYQAEYTCKTVYLVDSDFWWYDGIPEDVNSLQNLRSTKGYSIENDLLEDINPVNLMLPDERLRYDACLKIISEWFAACVQHRNSCEKAWKTKVGKLIDVCSGTPTGLTSDLVAQLRPSPDLVALIYDQHQSFLRGKTWAELLNLFLSAAGRHRCHDLYALMELAWAEQRNNAASILKFIKDSIER